MGRPQTRLTGDDVLVERLDAVLPQVFDYLVHRVRNRAAVDDLVSETMLSAFASARRNGLESIRVAWVIGIARHKLVDHWRREEREVHKVDAVASIVSESRSEDEEFEPRRARFGAITGGGGVAADDSFVWVSSDVEGVVYRVPIAAT